MAGVTDFLNRQREGDPKDEIGIGGFTALARVRERYAYSSSVPNSPVEDGSFRNDHIILNPLILTIEGNVSDIYLRPSPLVRDAQRLLGEVGNVTQFLPARTQAQASRVAAVANDAADAIRRVNAIIRAGQQALRFFGNQDEAAKSNIEQFIDAMEALHLGKQLISIDMPFRRHDNMVITSLTVDRNNEEEALSFSITAQQFRFVQTIFVEVARPAAGTGGQTEAEVAKGVQEGAPAERSLLASLFGG
jgi:hypothetical protein